MIVNKKAGLENSSVLIAWLVSLGTRPQETHSHELSVAQSARY